MAISLSSGYATTSEDENVQSASSHAENTEQRAAVDTYLLIHDSSKNMRRKNRIELMQNSMRTVLEQLPENTNIGLRVFGHRFSLDGPDACEDTELVIPFEQLTNNREDFETQFNLLVNPPLGGGAPVGLSLEKATEDLQDMPGLKEILLYMVDLELCREPDPLETIRAICQVDDSHLTLIGIGLKQDLRTLENADIHRLGCVDILNLVTPEDVDTLPERLLTRFSLEFRNAEGERVDPRPADKLTMQLWQRNAEGKTALVREKIKDASIKGSSLETIGLEDGAYLLELVYEGQPLREKKEILVTANNQTIEVVRLGKLLIDVTDSEGTLIENPTEREVKITITDADKVIRTVDHLARAEFDLLPGSRYNVLISYNVGGERHTLKYQEDITIREGNHQHLSVPLQIGALAGTVLNMQGDPADQVRMTLTRTGAPDESQTQEQATVTDEQGQYLFVDVQSGVYTLTFEKAGYKRESQAVTVVGGKMTRLEDIRLFHGLEIQVAGVSGALVDEAEITLTHRPSDTHIPVIHARTTYRNAQEIVPGTYVVTVHKPGYEPSSQTIMLEEGTAALDVSFSLPYYITVHGKIVDGKEDAVPDARVAFEHRHTTLLLPEGHQGIQVKPDGVFEAKLRVTGKGEEHLHLVWTDIYQQQYLRQIRFPLPQGPQVVALDHIRLPMNFLRLTLHDVIGQGIAADTIEVFHKQSGQSGILMSPEETGVYESTALVDGDYTIRVMKKGFQEVEDTVNVADGQVKHVALTLRNYITVVGTVVDGKQNRLSDASISFGEQNSTVMSLDPIVTGKDGRFQATLLVEQAKPEPITVCWTSSATERPYYFSTTFDLSAQPMSEFSPKDLGVYQLPANFVRLQIRDVSERGLPGVQVEFISSQGDITRGVELGDGLYESLDLPDGSYHITVMKPGYKEHAGVSDITVGQNQRDVTLDPLRLPHYATVTGVILNGNDEGVPNVEISFEGKASEQLERCRTDQHGKFSTTLLITRAGDEHWRAYWKNKEFQVTGVFPLPLQPNAPAHFGEIHLPANFATIPVNDIRGHALSDVEIEVLQQDGAAVGGGEFLLEASAPGVYQAKNLPDGVYTLSFHKEGYERGRAVTVTVMGGQHARLAPVRLGYYVTINGHAVNGAAVPVANALVTLQQTLCRVIPPAEQSPPPSEPDTRYAHPPISTDREGNFSATVLVTSPGIETLTLTWNSDYAISREINLSQGPGTQRIDVRLPINFVGIHLTDIADRPLAEASILLTRQVDTAAFPLQEKEPGTYVSGELADGEYDILIQKDRYDTRIGKVHVRAGEVKDLVFQIQHYVVIKGYVIDGKKEGVSAAVVAFEELKSEHRQKVISGTDGAFETQLLVKEIGKQRGVITYSGKHGTYAKEFWFELPAEPAQIALPREATRLPINYLTIEVKSVAATGVAGASVELIHQETGQRILARDNDHGNYEGVELPDGAYTILIRKDNYQAMQLEPIRVANGEHKSNILAPKFSHYITMSGVVVNGKHQGVAGAIVAMVDPKRLQECDPFTTRADGSFTLHALVTDVGSETIEVVWDEIYTTTLPVKLPSVPEHLRLDPIKLPINFIAVKVQDIYGNPLTGATVSFVKKQREASVGDALFVAPQTPGLYPAQELGHGLYESPALPDHTYLVVVRKTGYVQKEYPEIPIRSGETVADVLASLPHLITVSGNVTNGKGEGVTGVTVQFAQKNSQRSLCQLETDDQGGFSEQLLVTHPGKETLTLSKAYEFSPVRDHFTLSYDFPLRETPGQQRIDALRLPINFIPIQVQNVAGKGIDDADITITLLQPEDPHANIEDQIAMASTTFHPLYLGEGQYEARNLTDGTYVIAINKKGYESQERIISVKSGEVATEALFVLPHYVVVKGQIVEGRGNGIANAALEFDPQHAQLLPFHPGDDSSQNASPGVEQEIDQPVAIAAGPNGEFIARLLVKSLGQQQVRVSWNHRYARQFVFPLPEEPDPNFLLEEQITLPVNFAPFRVTDVLGQGMAGVEILVSRLGTENDAPPTVLAHPSGDGYYEAQELQDGTYTVTIRKAGYQEATSNFSVQGGERLQEQTIALPHYVTVQGTIVNTKGVGVAGATVTLTGMNSRVLAPEAPILTDAEGTFSLELLVTGAGSEELQEQIEVAWTDAESAAFLPQPNNFHISHPLRLSRIPGVMNLGLLTLPANFFPVVVRDIAGRGLSKVEVTFFDEQARVFPAKESDGGLYEGQNLPDGVYIVAVHKEGYQSTQQNDVRISSADSTQTTSTPGTPITFELPYYIQIRGKTVNGKGESLTSRVDIALAGMHSQIVPETIAFDQQGTFEASVLVHAPGREQLDVHWQGDYGQHTVSVPFLLPEVPQVVDLQRLTLPVNFIPIEVRDLLGYGVTGARVTLTHLLSGQDIPAQELGDGQYEGSNLPDGAYQIAVVKEGYKAVDNVVASVSKGVVSDTKSFRLQHYVWITGNVTNGEGEGVRDPVIEVERLRSFETSTHSDMTGRFEVELEVQEVGTERLFLTWNNMYRTPVTFLVPEKPEKKDLGDIRLPINFLSLLATDISGSTLPDVEVTVKEIASGRTQTYHTDLNGFCQTDDLPNGMYHVLVEKAGYRREAREVQVRDGESVALRFTLAHYVLVRGAVYDVLRHPVGEAEVIFEEFTDEKEQKLRTYTDAHTGRFDQRLLVNDAAFLERQKGHVVVAKGETSQVLTFKIPATPNQVINYNGLLFPINYLDGKVVDAEIKTIPIEYAEISLTPLPEQPLVTTGNPTFSEKETTTQETLHLTTDSLGRFEIGNLQQGEYKILIQKEGYLPHEDFIRISGLLQEQEFTLRKQ